MSIRTKRMQKESKSDHSVFMEQKNNKSSLNKQNSSAQNILTLHQTLGNQAVQRLFKFGFIQGKITVGEPNDKYEQEADRIADEVMRMPEPQVQRQSEEEEEEEMIQPKPIGDQITPLVQRQVEPEEEEEESVQPGYDQEPEESNPIMESVPTRDAGELGEEEEELIQTKPLADKPEPVTANLHSKIQSLKDGGQPLPASELAFFEPRFGRGFSNVRVHNDNRAGLIARSINARAFTHGRDVVFGSAQYAPGTSEGRRLMAHELTHVVQQDGGEHVRQKRVLPPLLIGHTAPYGRPQATLASIIAGKKHQGLMMRSSMAATALTRQVINHCFNTRLGVPSRPTGSARLVWNLRVPQTNAARVPLEWGLTRLANHLENVSRGKVNVLENNITLVTQVNLNGTNLLGTNATLTQLYPRGQGAFRFTMIRVGKNSEIHIEDAATGVQLISQLMVTRAAGTTGAPTALSVRGTRTRFSLVGNWTPVKLRSLKQALGLIRQRALALVNGLTFDATTKILPSTTEQGNYSPSNHRIQIYASAWTSHLPRRLIGGKRPAVGGSALAFRSKPAVAVILHEVGHAIDLRRLWLTYLAYKARRGNQAAQQKLRGARSGSGYRMQDTTSKDGKTTWVQVEDRGRGVRGRGRMQSRRLGAFRRVAVADGAQVIRRRARRTGPVTYQIKGGLTKYSHTSWVEFYAEAFAAYISDPTTLKHLRPKTYQHFHSFAGAVP